jgi:putrescine transport system substrate-binding protein
MEISRRAALATLGGALAMPYVRPSWAKGGTVNVYNWADYIGDTTLADFEAETGINVVYDTYSSAEDAQAKMLAGSTGYDVVDMAGIVMPLFIKAGVFAKLDQSRLTGWKNLDPTILKLFNSSTDITAYGSPYMWGSVGFAYNVDMVKKYIPDADLDSLDLIFKPENAAKLAECGISILDTNTDAMMPVLKYLGLDGDTTNPADYDKVAAAFASIRKYIRTFDNDNYRNGILNGELCVANSWSGEYAVIEQRAAEAGIKINLAYRVPKTGAPAWFDVMAIPADAPNKDNAYAFLNYLLRPEVIAKCTDATGYANANKAANPLVKPQLLADPAIYPDAATMQRMWVPKPLSEEQQRVMTRVWTSIKSG